MLGRFGRPRWQHKHASVRLKSVQQLDKQKEEEFKALQLMATGDSDIDVRCAAINRLSDTAVLLRFFHTESNKTIRQAATIRLVALLEGKADESPHFGNRLRTIRLLKAAPILHQLLDSEAEDACLEAAIDNIKDQSLLLNYAVKGRNVMLREQAARQVSQHELLQQLQQLGRDKKVLQYARETLKQQHSAKIKQQQQRVAIQQLLSRIEQHIKAIENPLFAPTLLLLKQQWSKLADDATEIEVEQANRLFEQADNVVAEQQLAQQQALEKQQQRQFRQQLLSQLQQSFSQLDSERWLLGTNQLNNEFWNIASRWQKPDDGDKAEQDQQTAFELVCGRWQQLMKQANTLFQLNETITAPVSEIAAEATTEPDTTLEADLGATPEAETAIASADSRPTLDNPRQQLRDVVSGWPKNIELPGFVSQLLPNDETGNTLNSNVVKASAKQHKKPRHVGLLHQLRQAIKSRNLKNANRVWQRLEGALNKYPDEPSQYQANSLLPALTELRDWHAFAANPKKDNLCEHMEALVASPLSHPAEQANAIHALHDQWHALMSSDQQADQTLWERFKQASDEAYAPCKEHFKELDLVRAANRQKRQQINQQLDDLLASIDWQQADISKLWQIRRQAPADWHAASPVRFTDVRDINRHFHGLLKQFDDQLDQFSQRNLSVLNGLIDKLQSLAEIENVDEAVDQAKRLQQQWRHAGWVHPRHYRKLDKQRKQLCDAVFKRRDSARSALRQQQAEFAERFHTAVTELHNLLNSNADSEALTLSLDQLEALGTTANKSLQGKADAVISQAKKRLQTRRQQRQWQQWSTLVNSAPERSTPLASLNELCTVMEIKAGCESPASAQQQRLALQAKLLEQAMKSSQNSASEASCLQLLEAERGDIEQGLHASSRDRLLAVIRVVSQ